MELTIREAEEDLTLRMIRALSGIIEDVNNGRKLPDAYVHATGNLITYLTNYIR